MQAARAIASVIGVARNLVAELQERDTAAFANRAVPPGGAAPVDQPFQLGARNDALISRPPRFVMSIRNRAGIVRLGATDFDEDCAHSVSKQALQRPSSPTIHDRLTV